MTPVDQYKAILTQILLVEVGRVAMRINEVDLSLEQYRRSSGYLSGVRWALKQLDEATDKLYGREPEPEPKPEEKSEDIYE